MADGVFVMNGLGDVAMKIIDRAPTQQELYAAKRAQRPAPISFPSSPSSAMEMAKKYLPYVAVAIAGYFVWKKVRG